MPQAKKEHLNLIDPVRKSDTMKYLNQQLKGAKERLIIAQKEKDAAREKKLLETISNLEGAIKNNTK